MTDLPFKTNGDQDSSLSWRATVHGTFVDGWGDTRSFQSLFPPFQLVAPTCKSDFNRRLLAHLADLKGSVSSVTRVDVRQGGDLVNSFTPSA